ncbi:MAG: hypothetical protein ACE5G9_10010 [Nitrospinales bacterium]
MSQITEFKHNKERNRKEREKKDKEERFRRKFPGKAAVEARIASAIDSAKNLSGLKTVIKQVLNGDKDTPGIIDALFELDR